MSKILKIEVYEITNEPKDEATLALKSTFNREQQTKIKQFAEESFGFKVTFRLDSHVRLETNFKNGRYKIYWSFELRPCREKGQFETSSAAMFWRTFKKWMEGYETDNNQIYWNQSGFKLDRNESALEEKVAAESNEKKAGIKQTKPGTSTRDIRKTKIVKPVFSFDNTFKTWLVYGSDYHYEVLSDEDVDFVNWTIHKDSQIGDWVYFYLRSPICAIVASGRVISQPKVDRKASQFSSVMPYFCDIEIYNLFDPPLTYHDMYNDTFIYDGWSLVRSQMQSSTGPQQIPYSILRHLDEVRDLRPF
ncbi:EVE domain-containing protein [Pirellulaceae bacterium]|nr:EVE domain-containing protein [Pirellulaceae bacterium]